MSRRMLLLVIVVFALLGATSLVFAWRKPPPPGKKTDQAPIKYEAEDGLPKDKAAEKRRDYAVLEATLNDLASPNNPEHKYYIKNVGPGREIVIDHKLCEGGLPLDLIDESTNIDGKDARSIPAEIQEDLKRRKAELGSSLADFKPTNPDIIVRDLDELFNKAGYGVAVFDKQYPSAWGYVGAYPPGYSKDGNSAVVVFEGGPNGIHGLNWVYMLAKKGKRWEVQWRHLCPRV